MRFLFIETRYPGKVELPDNVISKLPEKIGLFLTVQFISSLEPIKASLEKKGKKVLVFKSLHTKYPGQIYGCNLEKFDGVDAYLFIGDGLFHPKALAMGNMRQVHIWNPIHKKYSVIGPEAMEDELRRQRASYSRFLMAKCIGVIVTTKHGQSYLDYSLKLKKRYPEKEFYYIVMDTIDFAALEDFSFIEAWVNTACPRIGWDDTKRAGKPMVDIGTVI